MGTPDAPRNALESAERMMRWFRYDHLPAPLAEVSSQFCILAAWIVQAIPPGPERTVALRKLLEAKDAAVRAELEDGN